MRVLAPLSLWLLLGAACQSTASELSGLAELAPLDYAVLVTGGAFLTGSGDGGTFVALSDVAVEVAGDEPIAIEEVVGVLDEGRVFRRVSVDLDEARRRRLCERLASGTPVTDMQDILQQARDDGFDFLLVVEELQDGPIEAQGINGRWPVTFSTWLLLGIGALIPDHTFESRATLRVSVRDLQTGRPMHDAMLNSGPIDLALTERTDVLGLLTSILVPPFWVGSDTDSVMSSVQSVARRRLLVSLARDLKSASVRQRLRERSAAAISLDGEELVIVASESLSAVRLRAEPPLSAAEADVVTRGLLASLKSDNGVFRYRTRLPPATRGRLIQVLVATIRGSVASATFIPGMQ